MYTAITVSKQKDSLDLVKFLYAFQPSFISSISKLNHMIVIQSVIGTMIIAIGIANTDSIIFITWQIG